MNFTVNNAEFAKDARGSIPQPGATLSVDAERMLVLDLKGILS